MADINRWRSIIEQTVPQAAVEDQQWHRVWRHAAAGANEGLDADAAIHRAAEHLAARAPGKGLLLAVPVQGTDHCAACGKAPGLSGHMSGGAGRRRRGGNQSILGRSAGLHCVAPLTSVELTGAGVRPELLASLALRRAANGGLAM